MPFFWSGKQHTPFAFPCTWWFLERTDQGTTLSLIGGENCLTCQAKLRWCSALTVARAVFAVHEDVVLGARILFVECPRDQNSRQTQDDIDQLKVLGSPEPLPGARAIIYGVQLCYVCVRLCRAVAAILQAKSCTPQPDCIFFVGWCVYCPAGYKCPQVSRAGRRYRLLEIALLKVIE